jgi:hypothetical protein
MTSVCHDGGHDRASAAYAYLFEANSRYLQTGRWSRQMYEMAIDNTDNHFAIDPHKDCEPETGNFHGLDLDADLRLQANALNYVFFSRKERICRQSGNEVDARSYRFLAETELDKADNGRRSPAEISDAFREAETAAEMQLIRGC